MDDNDTGSSGDTGRAEGSGEAEGTAPGQNVITKTTRDLRELRDALQAWLATKFDGATITSFDAPVSNGMSSLTVLFDATWSSEGATRSEALVARFAPETTAVPVFPRYDLAEQFEIIRQVGLAGVGVPLPTLWWAETDPSHVGAPFFVMSRIDGQVPPDNMPYNLGSWVTEASAAERARLQDSTVAVLARIHGIDDAASRFSFLGEGGLRRHVEGQRSYYEWTIATDGIRVPLIERCFTWLEDHWPASESPTVLSWGDARIGNVMYRDFEPVAVFDWEMASLAPREVDLAWFIFLHRFFEDIAATYSLPGLPDFCRRDDVVATYVASSGYEPRDLDFYLMYAGLRHGIVMSQTHRRSVHFGEAERPADPDELILHRPALEALLAGTYTWP